MVAHAGPRREREHKIRTTQRRMMRKMLNTKRQRQTDRDGNEILENYVDWIQRATRKVEEVMSQYGVPDWVEESRRLKFRWAGQVCRRTDGRWTTQALKSPSSGSRRSGRPITRWSLTLDKFFDEVSKAMGTNVDWQAIATDQDSWHAYEDQFVSFLA